MDDEERMTVRVVALAVAALVNLGTGKLPLTIKTEAEEYEDYLLDDFEEED